MGSSQEIFRSLQDLPKLALLVNTEWSDGAGGLYSLDAWVGGQFLLYYETEKMVPQYQNLKCADYTAAQTEALKNYPYLEFCQRLGLLSPPMLAIIRRLDPQLELRKLFEAFIGIAQRQFLDKDHGYQGTKQWLRDLESFTHPQGDVTEKEAIVPSDKSLPGPYTTVATLRPAYSMSNGLSQLPNPPDISTIQQPSSPEALLAAQLSPSLPTTVAVPASPPSPTASTVPDRQKEVQELSIYTSRLKEYEAKTGDRVRYDEKREMPLIPPRFHCKVRVGEFSAEGRGSQKKEAQHRASKALQLAFPQPFE